MIDLTNIHEKYTQQQIEDVYINQGLTIKEAAKALELSEYAFYYLLGYYHISKRRGPKAGGSKVDQALARINKEEFINDYLVNNMRQSDIEIKYDIKTWVFEELVRHYDCKKDKSKVLELTHETAVKNAGSEEKLKDQINSKRKQTLENKTDSEKNAYRKLLSERTLGKNKNKTPWNKGLTKETDIRVAINAEHTKQANIEKAKNIQETDPKYFINWRNLVNQRMRENNTFNKSKPEDEYYEYLKTLYNEDDIIRQYKDERYPFACDFYIKSQDLFIECNYSWTHGGHLFNSDSEEDQQTLAEWQEKAKTSDFYKNAIETWTVRDVKKHETAKANNLNYEVIY